MPVYDQFKQHRDRVREPIRAAVEAYVIAALTAEGELSKPTRLEDGRKKLERLRDISVERMGEFIRMFSGAVWIPAMSVLVTLDGNFEDGSTIIKIKVVVDGDFAT